jgi:hypothetical protein
MNRNAVIASPRKVLMQFKDKAKKWFPKFLLRTLGANALKFLLYYRIAMGLKPIAIKKYWNYFNAFALCGNMNVLSMKISHFN